MCAGPLINVHLESGGNYWLIYEVVARFSSAREFTLEVYPCQPCLNLMRVVSEGKSTGAVQVSTAIIQETRLMLAAPQSVW